MKNIRVLISYLGKFISLALLLMTSIILLMSIASIFFSDATITHVKGFDDGLFLSLQDRIIIIIFSILFIYCLINNAIKNKFIYLFIECLVVLHYSLLSYFQVSSFLSNLEGNPIYFKNNQDESIGEMLLDSTYWDSLKLMVKYIPENPQPYIMIIFFISLFYFLRYKLHVEIRD